MGKFNYKQWVTENKYGRINEQNPTGSICGQFDEFVFSNYQSEVEFCTKCADYYDVYQADMGVPENEEYATWCNCCKGVGLPYQQNVGVISSAKRWTCTATGEKPSGGYGPGMTPLGDMIPIGGQCVSSFSQPDWPYASLEECEAAGCGADGADPEGLTPPLDKGNNLQKRNQRNRKPIGRLRENLSKLVKKLVSEIDIKNIKKPKNPKFPGSPGGVNPFGPPPSFAPGKGGKYKDPKRGHGMNGGGPGPLIPGCVDPSSEEDLNTGEATFNPNATADCGGTPLPASVLSLLGQGPSAHQDLLNLIYPNSGINLDCCVHYIGTDD